MFWNLLLQLYYAARIQAALLAWEWLTAPDYNDMGFVLDRMAQLPYVIITQSTLSASGQRAYQKITQHHG